MAIGRNGNADDLLPIAIKGSKAIADGNETKSVIAKVQRLSLPHYHKYLLEYIYYLYIVNNTYIHLYARVRDFCTMAIA
jgi:hypothetical protein